MCLTKGEPETEEIKFTSIYKFPESRQKSSKEANKAFNWGQCVWEVTPMEDIKTGISLAFI